jgi:DnaJ-class molecular chaperone
VTELKKAYQALALKYHPDKATSSASNQETFIKINHAWTILRDHRLREQYDVKWKERCLAQTYPIQDTVHFEEFEKDEEYDVENGETTTSSLDNSHNKACLGKESDCEKTFLVKGDNCGETCLTKGTGDVPIFDINNGIGQVQDVCAENTTKGENEVNLTVENETGKSESSPLANENVVYTYECRCGGNYILTGVDVKLKFDIVCCDTCSLSIQVIYNEDDPQ